MADLKALLLQLLPGADVSKAMNLVGWLFKELGHPSRMTTEVAFALPQLGVLLQYMQQQHTDPKEARGVVDRLTWLLHILALPEVQQQLMGQVQVQQLFTAVITARQPFMTLLAQSQQRQMNGSTLAALKAVLYKSFLEAAATEMMAAVYRLGRQHLGSTASTEQLDGLELSMALSQVGATMQQLCSSTSSTGHEERFTLSLLLVLTLPEVQAVLGGLQQVQQLLMVTLHARYELAAKQQPQPADQAGQQQQRVLNGGLVAAGGQPDLATAGPTGNESAKKRTSVAVSPLGPFSGAPLQGQQQHQDEQQQQQHSFIHCYTCSSST